MILSTLLNLLVVPVVYVAVAELRTRFARRRSTPPATTNGAANAHANDHTNGSIPATVSRTA